MEFEISVPSLLPDDLVIFPYPGGNRDGHRGPAQDIPHLNSGPVGWAPRQETPSWRNLGTAPDASTAAAMGASGGCKGPLSLGLGSLQQACRPSLLGNLLVPGYVQKDAWQLKYGHQN